MVSIGFTEGYYYKPRIDLETLEKNEALKDANVALIAENNDLNTLHSSLKDEYKELEKQCELVKTQKAEIENSLGSLNKQYEATAQAIYNDCMNTASEAFNNAAERLSRDYNTAKEIAQREYLEMINEYAEDFQFEVEGKKEKYPFVIIIDEWDCVVRNFSDRQDIVHEYLQFLHSLFKSEESQEFLALGYITGILPIKKIKKESALNNFLEYTMIDSKEFTPYFGFTEKETEELCKKYDMNFESVRDWYDGYYINKEHMYNPNSVYQAMIDHSLESYWKNTSAFDTINTFITLNFDGLKEDVMKMLSGGKVSVITDKFKNDLSVINSKDDALTALIHLGYLGYDAERRKAFIPNFEVATAFHLALETGNWSEIADTLTRCDEILWATIDGEAEKVAELLELSHDTYTSILKYNDENALSCAITMAYFTAPAYYTVVRELPSGKGFADIALIPRADSGNKPAMIIELKYDKTADTAIRQIKEKKYAGALKGYGEEVTLVGVSYDRESKKHECVIEKVRVD